MKTNVAGIFVLSGFFNVMVEYAARFLRQDHESGAASSHDLSSCCPRGDAGTSFSTIQPVCQHQTMEKRRREPIRPTRTEEVAVEADQSLQNNPRQSMRAIAKDLGMSEGTV